MILTSFAYLTEVIDRAINQHKKYGKKRRKRSNTAKSSATKLDFKCLGDLQVEECSGQCIYSRFQDRNYKFGSHQHIGI